MLDVRRVPRGVEVYEITGPLFFGAAAAFRDTLGSVAENPRLLIVRMRHVSAVDSTGLRALSELVHRCRAQGTEVYLAEVHTQPHAALAASAALDDIGRENVFETLDAALDSAREAALLPQPSDR